MAGTVPGLSDFKLSCLVLACLVYGVFGSPTPDHIGWPEAVVGGFLVLSVGTGGVLALLRVPQSMPFWVGAGQVFLFYGLAVSLSLSVFYGHPVSQALRDLVPFLFLFLPLFLWPLFLQSPRYGRALLFCGLFIGVSFSLRSILSRVGSCFPFCTEELLYLENMPTVLYAALILIGFPLQLYVRSGRARVAGRKAEGRRESPDRGAQADEVSWRWDQRVIPTTIWVKECAGKE